MGTSTVFFGCSQQKKKVENFDLFQHFYESKHFKLNFKLKGMPARKRGKRNVTFSSSTEKELIKEFDVICNQCMQNLIELREYLVLFNGYHASTIRKLEVHETKKTRGTTTVVNLLMEYQHIYCVLFDEFYYRNCFDPTNSQLHFYRNYHKDCQLNYEYVCYLANNKYKEVADKDAKLTNTLDILQNLHNENFDLTKNMTNLKHQVRILVTKLFYFKFAKFGAATCEERQNYQIILKEKAIAYLCYDSSAKTSFYENVAPLDIFKADKNIVEESPLQLKKK
jgi:hypothetical protein